MKIVEGNYSLTFGEFLVAKRKEREMPARELADALGISPVYIVYGRSGLVDLAKKCKITCI